MTRTVWYSWGYTRGMTLGRARPPARVEASASPRASTAFEERAAWTFVDARARGDATATGRARVGVDGARSRA